MPLDFRALALELDDLRTRAEEDPAVVLPADDLARVHELENLAEYVGGDLHVAANHGVTLLDESEAKREIRDGAEDEAQLGTFGPYIDWDRFCDDALSDWTVIEFDGETYYTRDV